MARSPRRIRSRPRTPTSASPRCPTTGSIGWRRCQKSKNVVHAAVQVVDIGGLVEGASKGEGLGNKFLANIREVDAIVFVLRAFEDDDVTGPTDPIEHLRVVEIELALADLETVEKRLNQAQRQSKLDKTLGDELEALEAAYDALSRGSAALPRRLSRPTIRETLAPYFLLTNRSVLAVVNVGEDDLDRIPEVEATRARRDERRRRQRRGDRHVRAARGRGGDDRRSRRAGRDARRVRPRRGRAVPHGAQRVPPARAAHVPHDRRQGDAGRGRSAPARRRPSAPAASTPTSSAASSAPR